jgi:hypothetical protein
MFGLKENLYLCLNQNEVEIGFDYLILFVYDLNKITLKQIYPLHLFRGVFLL